MQKKTELKKLLSVILCIVLIAAVALFTTGCQDTDINETPDAETSTTDDVATDEQITVGDSSADVTVLGEGETSFTFTVTDVAGADTVFEIRTDKTTVGDALIELGLIDGEASAYGLYVKTVNGVTIDYDTDGKYWAFYVNEEYASSGVDSTQITEGATYSFKVE